MKSDASIQHDQVPIGIVISHGSQREAVPMFFAYVWAPDPEAPEEGGASKAA
jgi:hypothetical protein